MIKPMKINPDSRTVFDQNTLEYDQWFENILLSINLKFWYCGKLFLKTKPALKSVSVLVVLPNL